MSELPEPNRHEPLPDQGSLSGGRQSTEPSGILMVTRALPC